MRSVAQLRDHARATADAARQPARRKLIQAGASPIVEEVFLAQITGWARIAPTIPRWRYAWVEAELFQDQVRVKPGGRSGTLTEGYALNLCELSNVYSGVQGNSVDDTGASYPAGFDMQAVGGGTGGVPGNEVTVWMREVLDYHGVKRPAFQYENADDGTCGAL